MQIKKSFLLYPSLVLMLACLTQAVPVMDYSPPTPGNGTSTSNTSIQVNVSITEANLGEVVYNWNGTNYTIYNDSLVLMMNFDNVSALGESGVNGSEVLDLSGRGNNGTLSDAVWTSGGRYNGAFVFDGTEDRINVFSPSFIDDSRGTLAAWISFGDLAGADRVLSVSVDGSSDDEFFLEFVGNDGDQLRVVLQGVASPWTADTADGLIADSGFHFVVLSSDGSTTRLYLDGVERALTDTTGTNSGQWFGSATNADVFTLGGLERTALYNDFTGTIDEVRVWNASLSAGEIYQQYVSNLNKYDVDEWSLYVNQSRNATAGLGDGSYTYQAFATDNAENSNRTGTRTITIDTLSPGINFTSTTPANGTIQTALNLEVNVSIVGQDLNSLIYNWNGTNYTFYNDSLVLMYNFDNVTALGENNSRVVDLSPHQYNGTMGNGDESIDPGGGKYGGALLLDGAGDYVDLNDHVTNLDDYATGSFSAWFKSSSTADQVIFSLGDKDTSQNMFEIGIANQWSSNQDAESFIARMKSGNTNRYTAFIPNGANYYSDGEWHFVAFVVGSDYHKIYMDGIEQSLTYDAGDSSVGNYFLNVNSGDQANLGSRYIGGSRSLYFNGTIDELIIWDRSLSADEVYQQYVSNLNKYDVDKWSLYVNQSRNATASLDDGSYTYQAFATDNAGNSNRTGARTITIDASYPQINLTSPTPANGTIQTATSIEVNVSLTEANLGSLVYDWNGTNYTYYNTSLVLMYNLDNVSALGETGVNGSEVFDLSGRGNNGTLSDAVWTSGGKYNGAFVFDGTEDRINVFSPSFIDDGRGTLAAWISFGDLAGADRVLSVSVDGSTDDEFFLEFVGNDGDQLRVVLQGVASPWTADTADGLIADSGFHFVVLSSDGSTTRLYLDGVERALTDTTGTNSGQWFGSATNADVFTLGGLERTALYNDFTGTIDEVRVWNASLSAGEIYQQYVSNLNKYDVDKWSLYVNQSRNATAGLDYGTYVCQVFATDNAGSSNSTGARFTVSPCLSDSDCSADCYAGDDYCYNNDVYRLYRDYSCSGAGTESASCVYSEEEKLVDECGTSTVVPGDLYCLDGSVYRHILTVLRGCDTSSMSCFVYSQGSSSEFVETCGKGFTCIGGSCVSEGSTSTTTSSSSTVSASTITVSSSTSSVSSTSSTTADSTTSTTIEICALPGDYPTCGEVTLHETVTFVTLWAQGSAALEDVVDLIEAWAGGSSGLSEYSRTRR